MQEIRRLKPSTTYPTSFIRTHMPPTVYQSRGAGPTEGGGYQQITTILFDRCRDGVEDEVDDGIAVMMVRMPS
jgi:hypothetical protein